MKPNFFRSFVLKQYLYVPKFRSLFLARHTKPPFPLFTSTQKASQWLYNTSITHKRPIRAYKLREYHEYRKIELKELPTSQTWR